MKSTSIFVLTVIGLAALSFIPVKKIIPKRIVWDKQMHEFNLIKIGPQYSAVYQFINKTGASIEIKEVRTHCGCTKGDFTSGKIKKNKKGFVTLIYNSEGRPGPFFKDAQVLFSNDSTYTLQFRGEVIE